VASDLRLDWCSYKAAKFAVEHWHYSQRLPVGPIVKLGCWENNYFIGVVLFSRGASANMLKPYSLKQTDGCELTRIALTVHRSPVTKIISLAIKLLKKQSNGLRLIISYADPLQKHIGAIYQAGNWVYTGKTMSDRAWKSRTGHIYHARACSENGTGFSKQFGERRKSIDSSVMTRIRTPGKHRYLYPLDKAMRKQIEHLAQPYPKRPTSIDSDASTVQVGEGGATPTVGLLIQ